MNRTIVSLLVLVITFLGFSALTSFAGGSCVTPSNGWSNPTSNPPGNNVCPPINTGNSWQVKEAVRGTGGLGIGVNANILAGYVFNVNGGGYIDNLYAKDATAENLTVGGSIGGNTSVLTDAGGGKAVWKDWATVTRGMTGISDWMPIDNGTLVNQSSFTSILYPAGEDHSPDTMCQRASGGVYTHATGACKYTLTVAGELRQYRSTYFAKKENNQWAITCLLGPANVSATIGDNPQLLCTK